MESLALDDSKRYDRHADAGWSRERGYRSGSPSSSERVSDSNEALGNRSSGDFVSSSRSVFPPPNLSSRSDVSMIADDRRWDVPTGATRPSPSYPFGNANRPSLPSLKTVLGHSISSAPRTPSPQTAVSRPSPSQASFDSSSLNSVGSYPNKKQRLDSTDYSARAHTNNTGPTFASVASAPLEPPYSANPTQHNDAFHPSSARTERLHGYRDQFPPLSAPGSMSSRASYHGPTPIHNTNPPSERFALDEAPGTRLPAHNYTPASVLEPTVAPNHAFGEQRRGSFTHETRESSVNDRSLWKQPASNGAPEPYGNSSYERVQPRFALPNDNWNNIPGSQDNPMAQSDACLERRDLPGSQPTEAHSSFPYSSNAPAFFMSNHYDDAQGKPRKRSNLPKQSTEIMKRWFDQNIANPYPSEEQKTVFSHETGISMTQVSNWFINHRRRCPELRDKREKNRVDRERDEQD